MKTILILLSFISFSGFAQSPINKFSARLYSLLNNSRINEELHVWVFLADKGPNAENLINQPNQIVSDKSLQRRSKVLPNSKLVGLTDIPVYQNYIEQIVSKGFRLKHKSKWFNGISGFISPANLNSISSLPFVRQIDVVEKYSKNIRNIEIEETVNDRSASNLQPKGIHSYNYGSSYTQMNQVNIPAVHDLGYKGQGVTICVMDAGFNNLTHEAFSTMNIIAKWDFVGNDPDVSGHSHGTNTLSVIGGFKEGKLIGPAFASNFLLARTEDDPGSETPIEEDNWIAAMEWADSIGVDVTSTSLGYLTFDPPYTSYTWQNMDGNTARITIAADLAVGLGISVVNSAGNNGFHPTQNTLIAPADGDSVLAIGAVTSSGTRSSFSSVGPTYDGRIKPDFMAMGSGVYAASSSGTSNYVNVSGTSFSCPIAAGVVAVLLSYNPNLTPIQIRDILRITSSNSSNPNREYGWGIIDALNALNTPVPVELTSFNVSISGNNVLLKWVTASESNSYGFSIERARENTPFVTVGFVQSAGNSSSFRFYNFMDKNLFAGKYVYRLKQIDNDYTFKYSNEVEVTISAPKTFYLFQNYPNPFNPSTTIKFSVPFDSNVKFKLYDILGNEIEQVYSGFVEAGVHEIILDFTKFSARLSSGVYLLKLEAEGFSKAIKMNLLK